MADRFGTNSSVYDLSRLMTFAVGVPPQNIFSAPIILDNPAITSGIALFSHTPQPFSVAVPAGQELRLIDLNFANTGLATSQFYGLKIQSNSDVVDTGAGIALFNAGRADAMYIDVAGKSGNPAGNNPTGIGIDVNKDIASSNERASANSSQQGIQIWDWSTTDQGVGGPRCLFLNKFANMGTDHILATLRTNRNALQIVMASLDGTWGSTQPLVTVNDEDTGQTWWRIIASGEQVFNKDGIGIQWITPGAKTAYILASTNDLKLKSGGTGVRFVNQADTQTIVMMQDDLSVDIINNETRFQAIKIVSDRIEQYATNALGSISLNYNGYNGGTTQFRDTKIFDGKQNVIAMFTGTSRNFLFATATDKATTLPQILIGAGVSTWHDTAGAWNTGVNAWHDGTNYKRLIATNTAGVLYFTRAGAGACEIYFNTDAGNTVDSTITLSRYYHFGQSTIGFLGASASVKATVSGYTGGGTALGSLLTGLNGYGLVTNSSTDGTPGGSMYADDISQTETVGAANTEVKVSGGLTGGTVNGFTFQNNRELLCSVAGKYEVMWGMSVSSGTNNENLSGGVVINTVTWQHNTEGSSNQNNSNNAVHIGGCGWITLAVNDTVGLFVENESAAHNITVRHANLVVKRVSA